MKTILIVEDTELNIDLITQLLEDDYKLLVARDGDEAKALLQKHGSTIDLMLLDVVMPKTNGPQVYEFARKVHPGLPALFSTGYGAESALLKDLLEKESVAILQKPYSLHVLGVKIREILDRRPAGE